MIDPKELRFGNIFWEEYGGYGVVRGLRHIRFDEGKYITDIQFSGLRFNTVGQISSVACYPVSLTDEFFERIKFEWSIRHQGYKIGNYVLRGDNKSDQHRIKDLTSSGGGYIKSEIKSLHELQNIYFLLTGEELQINL